MATSLIRGIGSSRGDTDPIESDDYLALTMNMKRLDIDDHRWFGKSSGVMLVQAALDVKKEYAGKQIEKPSDSVLRMPSHLPGRRREFWDRLPVSVPNFMLLSSLVD